METWWQRKLNKKLRLELPQFKSHSGWQATNKITTHSFQRCLLKCWILWTSTLTDQCIQLWIVWTLKFSILWWKHDVYFAWSSPQLSVHAIQEGATQCISDAYFLKENQFGCWQSRGQKWSQDVSCVASSCVRLMRQKHLVHQWHVTNQTHAGGSTDLFGCLGQQLRQLISFFW